MRRLAALLLLLSLTSLTGCTTFHYLTQATVGQERLNQAGIDIDEIVRHRYLDKRTRDLLAHVPRIKAFGEENGLRHTNNYERYVWLGRSAVVWVVTACDPVAFRPKTQSFPIVGSITYTGWFDKGEADARAAQLRAEGWDVDVRMSPAYSTLGWFDDPILSTMISPWDDAVGDLADVVLHETLHATFFVPGQSTLNESVASFFGEGLSLRYLDASFGPDSLEKERTVESRVRGEQRAKKMQVAYGKLEKLYASRVSRAEKLAEKQTIIDALRAEIHLTRPLTNATLIQYKTYGSGQEELATLLERCGGDYKRMLKGLERVRAVAKRAPPHTDPALLLRPVLASGGCEPPPS